MNRGLTKRAILLTTFIWLGIFSAFTSTAVALTTFTSQPLFALLILVGLIASTLVADLYVTDSVRVELAEERPADEPRPPVLRGTSQSEPCVGGAPEGRKFFSSPSVISPQLPCISAGLDAQRGEAHKVGAATGQVGPEVDALGKCSREADAEPSCSAAVAPMAGTANGASEHRYLYDAFVDSAPEEVASCSFLHRRVLSVGSEDMLQRLREVDRLWGPPLRAGSPPEAPKLLRADPESVFLRVEEDSDVDGAKAEDPPGNVAKSPKKKWKVLRRFFKGKKRSTRSK